MTEPRPEPTDELLAAWLAGDVGAEPAAAIEELVAKSPDVAARVDQLADTMALLDQAVATAPRDGFAGRLTAGVRSGVAASVTTTARTTGRLEGPGSHRRRRSARRAAPGAWSGSRRLERLNGALAVLLIVAVTGGLGVVFFRSQAARQLQLDTDGSDGRPADGAASEDILASDGVTVDPVAAASTAASEQATDTAAADPDSPQSADSQDDGLPGGPTDSDGTTPTDQTQPSTGDPNGTGSSGQPSSGTGPATGGQGDSGQGDSGQGGSGQGSSGQGTVDQGGAGTGGSGQPTGEASGGDLAPSPAPPPAVQPGPAVGPSIPTAPVPPVDNPDPVVEEDAADGGNPPQNPAPDPAPDPVTTPGEEGSGGGTQTPAPAAPPPAENEVPAPAVDAGATSPRVLDSQTTLAGEGAARGYFGGRGEVRAQLGLGPADARARGASHLSQLQTAPAFSDGTPPSRCAGVASSLDPSVIVTVETVTYDGQPALAYLVVTGSPTLDSARVFITERAGCGVLASLAVTT